MFSWATQQLEILAQTVAPPPTDAPSRFVYCVQRNDEASAQSCLAEMEPLGTLVQPSKGSYPLHLACQYNLTNLIQQLMNIPGANIQVTDFAGNTALHYACLTESKTSIDTVRLLVTHFGASVVAKNSQGQTPYDVALVNTVRQYLLPLQLQQETRNALDNGGIGLPPGIDLGGLQIRNSALPPPPIGGMGGLSPPPPPTTPTHSVPIVYPKVPPPAPTSGPHTYSRTGQSSAAIFSNKYKSDGFHSSSSDVNLQIKYGHLNSGNMTSTVPPPPLSGNMNPSSAPPSVGYPGAANPYAAFSTGAMKTRYPVYNTTGAPGMQQPPAPLSGGYHFGANPKPVSANLTTFNPSGNGSATQPGSGFQQLPPALTPQQPAVNPPKSPFFPPPPLSSMSQPQTQQQFAHAQHSHPQQLHELPPQTTLTQPIAIEITLPSTQSTNQGGAHQSMSAQAKQPSGKPSPNRVHAHHQQSPGSGNAHQLFSTQPTPSSGNSQHLLSAISAPVSGNAQDIFGSPAPNMEQPRDFGISSRSQPNIPISQQFEQATSTVAYKSANELFASELPENVPLTTSLHSANGLGIPEQPKQELASIYTAPMPQTGPVIMTGIQDSLSPCASTANDLAASSTGPSADTASFFETPSSKVGDVMFVGDQVEEQEVVTIIDSDDVMMDIPLSPNEPPALRSNSSQQRVTANSAEAQFDSIGMPPPPFSSKQ